MCTTILVYVFLVDFKMTILMNDNLAYVIDEQNITLVFNFEMPLDCENYLHRIRKSCLYCRNGVVINIVDDKEMEFIHSIERFYNTQISDLPEDISEIVSKANKATE